MNGNCTLFVRLSTNPPFFESALEKLITLKRSPAFKSASFFIYKYQLVIAAVGPIAGAFRTDGPMR
jgi:hypothetical protein